MAELNGGGIQYDVINTPVGHVNNLDETPVSFGIRPDLFYAKIDDSSRIEQEAKTLNNPVIINLREFEW